MILTFYISAIKAFSLIKGRSINNVGRYLSEIGKGRPRRPNKKGRKPPPPKYPANGSRAYLVLYDDEEDPDLEYPAVEEYDDNYNLDDVESKQKFKKRSADDDGIDRSYQYNGYNGYNGYPPPYERKQFRHRAARPARPPVQRKP